MNYRSLWRDSLIVAFSTCVIIGLVEAGLRVAYLLRNAAVDVVLLPYTAAQDWGVIPPWIDGLRILEPDPVLLWRNRTGVHRTYLDVYGPARVETDRIALLQQFIPRVPDSMLGNPVWSVSINSQGFRGREFTARKSPSAFRIVCLGDSWTFGANVTQEHTYPQRLAALLENRYAGAEFEVLNLGVMGYSSRQGLELLRRRVLELDADLLVIGFAMNDAIVSGWRDKDSMSQRAAKPTGVADWLNRLEAYKLARYGRQRFLHKPWTIGDYLQRVAREDGTPDAIWTGRQASETADYNALEPITRVAPQDYEQNLVMMIELARGRGMDVVLAFNELFRTPYQTIVQRVAAMKQVPLVDSQQLLADARESAERALEEQLDLRPPGERWSRRPGSTHETDLIEVVFRVFAGRWPVESAIYIAGHHPQLGNALPNRVRMYDDGTHGDQRSGDRVWSYAARLTVNERLFYVYTNSGRQDRWEGLDIPDLRFLTVPRTDGQRPVYRPIETFGELTLQADGWHTNSSGYALIAKAVADVLEQRVKVREHVDRRSLIRSSMSETGNRAR